MTSRRDFLLSGLVLLGGCSAWDSLTFRSQSPEEPEEKKDLDIRMVGDLAVPYNMHLTSLEAVGLVTRLKGTGSDPRPSAYRDELINEMQIRGVKNPNQILASRDVSLVLARGIVRPGLQKGDHFDLELRVPSQSETTSLRGGYLLQVHLKELQVQNNTVRNGHTYALAEGPVLVDPSADPQKDHLLACRGRVLGGGIALKSRPLALVLKNEQRSVFNAAKIETAINRRFHSFEKGVKVGMAKAKDDHYIQLDLHPRYKENVQRYMAVVRAVALRESETERMDRVTLLERQLLDPLSASRAALQLEAMGKPGLEVLQRGLGSRDPEVRFYAAEAMAYLDDTRATAALAEAARNVPAFRVFALAALSALNDMGAAEKLRELMQLPSAETRYGAFRALWTMSPDDPGVRGEMLGGFGYHVLDCVGPPMVHVTRSRRAEIVLFGREQYLQGAFHLEAGNRILVSCRGGNEVTVSRYAPDEADQKRLVSTRVDDVVRAVVELGGAYPDVVQALQQAKAAGALPSRFEVDALPEAGRTYERFADDKKKGEPPATSPVPDLFNKQEGKPASTETDTNEPGVDEAAEAEKPGPVKAFFAKMKGEK